MDRDNWGGPVYSGPHALAPFGEALEQQAGAGPEAALWQCDRCRTWTRRGQVHSCPNSAPAICPECGLPSDCLDALNKAACLLSEMSRKAGEAEGRAKGLQAQLEGSRRALADVLAEVREACEILNGPDSTRPLVDLAREARQALDLAGAVQLTLTTPQEQPS